MPPEFLELLLRLIGLDGSPPEERPLLRARRPDQTVVAILAHDTLRRDRISTRLSHAGVDHVKHGDRLLYAESPPPPGAQPSALAAEVDHALGYHDFVNRWPACADCPAPLPPRAEAPPERTRFETGQQPTPVCQCEDAAHFRPRGNGHDYLGVPAGEQRAVHVGRICDACAHSHLAGHLLTSGGRA